ncbi:MAG: peptidase T [Rhodothermales bacterium]
MSEPVIPTDLPPVAARFLRYVQIDTQSDPASTTIPSTEKQKDLSRLLADELRALGVRDVEMDAYGYVYATLPAVDAPEAPVLGLLAHVDTSPDASGAGVKPIIHRNYDGRVLTLPGNPAVTLDPSRQPALLNHLGHDLITSDGTTLLGSDDKAGVAILMQLAEDLVADTATPRPEVRLCFTIDEEIGRGVDKLDLDRFGAAVAYTIDGSDMHTVFAETFNAAEATIRVTGRGVHPGYAKDIMVNAARILCEMVATLPQAETPEHTAEREGYIHLHGLHAGDVESASAHLILRDFSDEGMARRLQLLERLVERYRIQYPTATIALETREQYKNMRAYIDASDPRVVSLAFDAAERAGITLREEVVRGGTDGARLSELGIPTPNLFNGGHDYHSCFEWNTVQNLVESLRYLRVLLGVWAEAPAR